VAASAAGPAKVTAKKYDWYQSLTHLNVTFNFVSKEEVEAA